MPPREPFGADTDASATASAVALERSSCDLCGDAPSSTVYDDCIDRHYWRPGRFDVVRCAVCGLVRTDPRPTEDSIGAFYPSRYAPYTWPRPITRHRAGSAAKWLVRLPFSLRYGFSAGLPKPPHEGARFVDIGCGSGALLAEMAPLGWQTWGIEPNRALARDVAKRLAIPADRIFAGRLQDAPFPAGTFDFAAMLHVLEHLHRPREALVRTRELLRPGGRLWIVVPNFESPDRRVFGRLWRGLEIPRHVYHFSPGTVARALGEAGLVLESCTPYFDPAVFAGSVRLTVDAALRRRRAFEDWRLLRYALAPVASIWMALGSYPVLSALARRP